MQGYDTAEALRYMMSRVRPSNYTALDSTAIETMLRYAIEADLAYMKSAGVLAEDGDTGDAYYDDDDAFEYIVDEISRRMKLDEDAAMQAATLINDYMDWQEEYMEKLGLLSWD